MTANVVFIDSLDRYSQGGTYSVPLINHSQLATESAGFAWPPPETGEKGLDAYATA